ncbi:MAG: ROK family protein [Actinobacteria bacterium]|nr:ROK family protein [Actinomycetota bacterium]
MTRERAYLAVDIGGTKLSAGIVSLAGKVLAQDRTPTPRDGVWDSLASLVVRVQASRDVDVVACGVGCGGPMSDQGDKVSNLHITSWSDFPLRSSLASLTGLPTFVDNDAKAVVLGETWCGAAVGCRGCLEAQASGTAIAEMTGRPAAEASLAVIEQTGIYVGRAVASVAVLLDLRLAVIGGSVALGFGDPFYSAVQAEVDRQASIKFSRGVQVRPTGLGADAPLVGAAAVARRHVE